MALQNRKPSEELNEGMKEQFTKNYLATMEAWDQNLNYYNSLLNLLYGLLLGFGGSLLVQSFFGVLTEIVRPGYIIYIYAFLVLIALTSLTILALLIYHSMRLHPK